MKRSFNTTGICVENLHYMVDIKNKIDKIEELVEKNKYFLINRPRQFGKTTTLSKLHRRLENNYLVIRISFEGIGYKAFSDEELMSKTIIKLFSKSLRNRDNDFSKKLGQKVEDIFSFADLNKIICDFIYESKKEVVLIIDEVDKSNNDELFLEFLEMFKDRFKSVILVGIYYNLPWNREGDFDIDMNFNCSEIETMISDYNQVNKLNINVSEISKEIYFFTNGYPFLVSRICQIIDEKFYPDEKKSWTLIDIQKSVSIITLESNTLFKSLIKNIENNKELYTLIKRILINCENIVFDKFDPIMSLGVMCGIFNNLDNCLKISNKIFEETLYNYIISKLSTTNK